METYQISNDKWQPFGCKKENPDSPPPSDKEDRMSFIMDSLVEFKHIGHRQVGICKQLIKKDEEKTAQLTEIKEVLSSLQKRIEELETSTRRSGNHNCHHRLSKKDGCVRKRFVGTNVEGNQTGQKRFGL